LGIAAAQTHDYRDYHRACARAGSNLLWLQHDYRRAQRFAQRFARHDYMTTGPQRWRMLQCSILA
jgi:hypothetical protein